MFFSIQIPTYNQQDFIGQAIESCLNQNFDDFEIVISNDCSTDNTENIVKQYLINPCIKYHENTRNLGRVGNYNYVLNNLVSGKYILNLDGDDYLVYNDFLNDASVILESNKDAVVLLANQDETVIEKIPEVKKLSAGVYIINGSDYFYRFPKVQSFFHAATFYKREDAIKIGFYNNPSLITDFHSVGRLFLHGKVILLCKKVVFWRNHGQNASTTLTNKQVDNELAALKDMAEYALSLGYNKNRIKLWLTQMEESRLNNYITLPMNINKRLRVLKYCISHSRKFSTSVFLLLRFFKYLFRTK